MKRRIQVVDVFSDTPLLGNPLTVVLDSDGLTKDDMQRITRWMNHSETTFLLKPEDDQSDYRVRIFTLNREIPFAGHPTLGSCRAWLSAGGKPREKGMITQACGAGRVKIRDRDGRLSFSAPPILRGGPVSEDKLSEIVNLLRIARDDIVDAQWVDNGPGWVAVLLKSAEAVLNLEPAREHHGGIDLGVVGPYQSGQELAYELRALFTDANGMLREDPVTGSLNASVAQWLLETGRASAPYKAGQGRRVGCDGRIYISRDEDGTVWTGGGVHPVFSGQASF